MKPLGRKNYGSIGHLPNSRMGPADSSVPEGQGRICTEKVRDKLDRIIVTEKLDGTNVGIANVDGDILALQRAGYLASSSPYKQHHMFHRWVAKSPKWSEILKPGERLVGEWMALAHGTRYSLPQGPFAAFDLMVDGERLPHDELFERCSKYEIATPRLIHDGGPLSVERAMKLHGPGDHGADEPEGVVYRVERRGIFEFLAKWVRPDKVDGKYLVTVASTKAHTDLWNWSE